MKFGIFLPNGSNGYIPSAGSNVYMPTYKHNLDISLEAERQGLDFVLSMMKYKGFGGETGYWDSCLDSFTLMAAIAAATSTIQLFPSVTLLASAPPITARMVATIDDISEGRCGLNIVTGWNKPEYTQMGMWPGDEYFEKRYEYAAEYLSLVKRLWTEDSVTHNGEYFNLEDCVVLPKPGREIPIVCAGQSPKGLAFTAQHGNRSFVIADEDSLGKACENMRNAARETGRDVGVYGLFQLVLADTDAEAARICEDIVAKADKGAIMNILKSAGMDTNKGGTADRMKEDLDSHYEKGNPAFMRIPVIHGGPETVAAKIDGLAAKTGVDGILFSMPDFVPAIRDFGERVMPKLKC
jgi:pyrimidine oxygenase